MMGRQVGGEMAPFQTWVSQIRLLSPQLGSSIKGLRGGAHLQFALKVGFI